MFTGLIQDVGTVTAIARGPMTRLSISTALPSEGFEQGESVALDGACLTVVAKAKGRFEVEAAPETLRCTSIGSWTPGTRVNLERALRLGDRLGGHMVQGHVDAVATLLSREQEGGSVVLGLELPEPLALFFIEKGSVAVDGVSLTVNRLSDGRFWVQLIPETQAHTGLAQKAVGAKVNLEADVIGKYVARLVQGHVPQGRVDEALLRRAGFI